MTSSLSCLAAVVLVQGEAHVKQGSEEVRLVNKEREEAAKRLTKLFFGFVYPAPVGPSVQTVKFASVHESYIRTSPTRKDEETHLCKH